MRLQKEADVWKVHQLLRRRESKQEPEEKEEGRQVNIVVCGSRTWWKHGCMYKRMDRLPKRCTVIEGGADGADRMARGIALALGFNVITVWANWTGLGKQAGPARNRRMIKMDPELVLAFHEDLKQSKGTVHTVRLAREIGIPVEVISG